MMTRKEWRKAFKRCKHKFIDGRRDLGIGANGSSMGSRAFRPGYDRANSLCSQFWPIGTRCTYRKCPLKDKECSQVA